MKYTWLVEKYLEGELHGHELKDFELEILRNSDAAKELEEIRKLHAFTREQLNKKFTDNLLENKELQNKFQTEDVRPDLDGLKIHKLDPEQTEFQKFKQKVKLAALEYQIHETEKGKVVLNKKVFWGAAALITILICFSLTTFLLTNRTSDLQVIYSEFYQPYPYNPAVRDLKTGSQNVFNMGREAYINANYGLALDYFNQVSAESPSYSTTFLLKGICYMEMDQFDQAIQSFNQLTGNRIMNEYGEWYRGLCYIRLNEPDQARNEFKKIIREGGYFSKQAKSILKSL